MSYRTKVNGYQIFGNNESYKEWLNFIKSKGIEVDNDGCYEGDITDVMGAIETLESIVKSLEENYRKRNPNKSLFDFRSTYDNYIKRITNYPDDDCNSSITDDLMEIIDNAYIFIPIAFINACDDLIERAPTWSTKNHLYCYKLKEGAKIHVSAY